VLGRLYNNVSVSLLSPRDGDGVGGTPVKGKSLLQVLHTDQAKFGINSIAALRGHVVKCIIQSNDN